MDLPSKHVLDLSKKIGARGAGSDGEKAAASYILRSFSNSDIEVDVESFSTWHSDLQGTIIVYLLAVFAFLAFRFSFVLSIIVSIFAFLAFQMETYSWAVVSRLAKRSAASNIIGRVKPREESAQLVVLVANYDTPKSSPLGSPSLARYYRALYVASFVSITMIMVLSIGGQGASLLKISDNVVFLVWLFFSPFALCLLGLAFAMAWGEGRSQPTAGANDNASGVGVMLSVLAAVAANPLENTTVWGVATARGSAGARGMVQFLKRHRSELRDACIVNIDHVGRGPTRVLTREGVMLGFRASRKVVELTFRAARGSRSIKLEKGKCRVKKSDALVATVRGFRAVTIAGCAGGTFPGWRNDGDTYDRIQRGALDRAAKLVHLLLDEVDEMASPGSKRRRKRMARESAEKEKRDTDPEKVGNV